MESLKLKVEKRNKLYFNKFRFKATIKVQGAAYTYYTPNLETFVGRMEKLRGANNKLGVKEYWDEVNLDQISQLITWRNTVNKDKFTLRIQGDTVSFFSNELPLLQTLDSIDSKVTFTEAICYEDCDQLYFKKQPKYKYRTYFKARQMPKHFSESVRSLDDIYSSLNFSKTLLKTLFTHTYHPFRYLHGSYYVEYNDQHMLTILSMWFPDMLGKTYSLAKEP